MPELAEGARLEIVCPAKSGTEGSNPSLSATKTRIWDADKRGFSGSEISRAAKSESVKNFLGFDYLNFYLRFSAKICVPMKFMIAGSCATEGYQPRQVRKEAAAVTASVCRRVAWLSPFYWCSFFMTLGTSEHFRHFRHSLCPI